jgi:hypothetical protein
MKNLNRLLAFRSEWYANSRRILSSSCEQTALHDLSWGVEDGCTLNDSVYALDNRGGQSDTILINGNTDTFFLSFGMKGVEATGHGFVQAVRMSCGVEF